MKVTYKTWTVKELEAAASPVSQPEKPEKPEKPVSQSVEKPVSQSVEKPVEVKKRAVPVVAELPKKPTNIEPVAFKKSYTKKAPKKPQPQPENQKPVHVNPDIVELPDYKPETEVVPKIISQPVEKPVIQIEKPVIQIEKQEIIELPPAPATTEDKIPVVVADEKYKKKSFDLFPEIKEVRRKYEPLVKIEAPKFTSEKKHRTLYKQRF